MFTEETDPVPSLTIHTAGKGEPLLKVTAAGITYLHRPHAPAFVAWPDVVRLGDIVLLDDVVADTGRNFVIRVSRSDSIIALCEDSRHIRRFRRKQAVTISARLMPGHPAQVRARMEPYRPDFLPRTPSGSDVVSPPSRDDPATLSVRANLAEAMARRGSSQSTLAVTRFEALLPEINRVFGPDDPWTLETRIKLADAYSAAGEHARMIAELLEVKRAALTAHGPFGRVALDARERLADAQAETGDPDAIVAELTAIVADSIRSMDPDDRQVLRARADLAHWTGIAGDPDAAAQAFESLLSDCRRVLGAEDDMTFGVRFVLEDWRVKAGNRPRSPFS